MIYQILYLCGLLFAEGLRFQQRRRHQQEFREQAAAGKRIQWQEKLTLLLLLLGMWVLPIVFTFTNWLSFADYGLPRWVSTTGLLIFAGGLWLRWRAQRDLGRSWSSTLVIWQEHHLITDGIYHYIRHPLYAAQLLWAFSQALLLHNWFAGLGGLAAVLPLVVLRMPREEEMMLAQFGDAYREYMRRSGRIFPKMS